jgi:tRNA-dihydrouridine synthase B
METPRHSITIRGLHVDPPLFLAPMAGLTHSALRQVIQSFGGVGLLSTEMLSARRLPTDSPRFSPFLIRTKVERPLSHQLLFSDVSEIGPAIKALHAVKADVIDLNMGCPAATVGRFGAGVKLMEQPNEVRRIVAEARKLTNLPLTVKIRIGLDLDEQRLRSFCVMLEEEGIDLLSIHARLTHESFERRPRWDHIANVKEWIRVPVIANGGIFTVQDAENCLRISGADGLMLGRGAVIRPWLFAEIARELFGCKIAPPVITLP